MIRPWNDHPILCSMMKHPLVTIKGSLSDRKMRMGKWDYSLGEPISWDEGYFVPRYPRHIARAFLAVSYDEWEMTIDHITPKSEGGGEELSNKCLLHRHCHDERHARRVNGICAKDPIIEEPDAGKLACPVLKPSGGGDPFAQVNNPVRLHSTLGYMSPRMFEETADHLMS
jgi:hypothetical protein